MPYDFAAIEAKWQEKWESEGTFYVNPDESKPKFYCLEMFPYPSVALHMGHLRNYSIGDLMARFLTMRGYNVLHPMGFDAFGLPRKTLPLSMECILRMDVEQHREDDGAIEEHGCSYDWRRRITTCHPSYYRWNQWFFLKLYEKGLAYRAESPINWCPAAGPCLLTSRSLRAVTAGDGSEVTKRKLEQWFLPRRNMPRSCWIA